MADGSEKKGVAIDIDTIAELKDMSFSTFSDILPNELDKVHSEAKTIFFGCLTSKALKQLEPEYD